MLTTQPNKERHCKYNLFGCVVSICTTCCQDVFLICWCFFYLHVFSEVAALLATVKRRSFCVRCESTIRRRWVWNGLYIKKCPGSSKLYNGSEWLLIFNSGLRRMYRHSVSSVENMLDSWEPRFIYSKGKSVSSWLKQKSSNICLYKTVFRTSNLWPVFCFAFSSTLLRSSILTSLRAYIQRQLEIMVYKVLNMYFILTQCIDSLQKALFMMDGCTLLDF